MPKSVSLAAALFFLLSPLSAFAQQDYVGLFDLYNGFTWFDSPSAKLQERGYHLQAGVNMRTWLAMGFDYSVVQGTLTLTPDLLKAPLRDQIAGQLSQLEAGGYCRLVISSRCGPGPRLRPLL